VAPADSIIEQTVALWFGVEGRRFPDPQLRGKLELIVSRFPNSGKMEVDSGIFVELRNPRERRI
jgi:hypothetical protein